MNIIGFILLSVALAAQGAGAEKVESTFDKGVNFGALRTYSWNAGLSAFNPETHKVIVTAIEAEMTRLGFTKATTGADVTIAYHSVASIDVDLKALDKVEKEGRGGETPTKTRGRLVVIMRNAGSTQQIWSASTREYVDPEPVKLAETIRSVTARLFQAYPTAKPTRSK